MRRKNHHAYHDFSPATGFDAPENTHDAPEQQFMDQRLVQAQMSQLSLDTNAQRIPTTKYSNVPRPTPLVDRIPGPAMPTTLNIGGASREPVPRVPEERDLGQKAVDNGINGVFDTYKHAFPPPADTAFESVDQGISEPDFMRLSMYYVPATSQLRESTNLPLALYVRPFAREEVPLADFSAFDGETMPPRCRRCRAYMNPSMRFTHGGAKFVCNLCLFENPCPEQYYNPIDTQTGKRIDWHERPELGYGTYEFVVAKPTSKEDDQEIVGNTSNGEYVNRLNVSLSSKTDKTNAALGYGSGHTTSVYGSADRPFRYVFGCEVTRDSVQKGVLSTFVASVRETLPYLREGCPVAIMTFNSQVMHFRRSKEKPQMLVSSPKSLICPPDVFYDPVLHRSELESLLDLLEPLYAATTDRQSCLGDAVASVNELPSFASGGRLTVWAASLPTAGTAPLVQRDHSSVGPTAETDSSIHKQLFNATSPKLMGIATSLANNGWGCDLLSIPTAPFMDLATLGVLPRFTGGKLKYYPRFAIERDARRVMADFMALVTQPVQARHVQTKIRTSTGLQLSSKLVDHNYSAKFMDSDTNFVVTFDHDNHLDPRLDAHFQAAVMYTNDQGEKRVRVCNSMAGISSKPKAVYKFLDLDVIMTTVIRQTLAQLGEHTTSELRTAVTSKVNDVFTAVRKNVGLGVPESQLLMPVNLRTLPAYMLAFTKSVALGSRSFSTDTRVADAYNLNNVDLVKQSLALYPRIYSIENDRTVTRLAVFDEISASPVPVLVFDGSQLFLYLSAAVSGSTLAEIFGVRELSMVSPWIDEVPAAEVPGSISETLTTLSRQEALRVGRSWVPLQIVRQGLDGSEYQLRQLMVEDPIGDSPSYMNFVVKLHEVAKKAGQEKSSWF